MELFIKPLEKHLIQHPLCSTDIDKTLIEYANSFDIFLLPKTIPLADS